MSKVILAILLAAMCFGFQEGTAESCDNYRSTVHKCMCSKAMMACKMPGDRPQPDYKCKTYCRPEACRCSGPGCTSRK